MITSLAPPLRAKSGRELAGDTWRDEPMVMKRSEECARSTEDSQGT